MPEDIQKEIEDQKINIDEEIKKEQIQKKAKDWSCKPKDIIIVFLIAIAVSFVIKPAIVRGESMVPTYDNEDVLLISPIIYNFRDPKINDIVIVSIPEDYLGKEELIVKRVVAVEGDTVEIINGTFYRNGEPVKEDYINEKMSEDTNLKKITISKDCVFVMGDNRNYSADSRIFGEVQQDYVADKVVVDNSWVRHGLKSIFKLIGKI